MKNIILSKKIKEYSSLVGCLMGVIDMACAQAVYIDVDPDISIEGNDSYELDLNNDGITDFSFEMESEWSGSSLSRHVRVDGNSVAFTYSNSVKVLGYGDTIDNNLYWDAANNEQMARHSSFPYCGACDSSGSGNWLGQFQKFLALRFKINGENHYGWARLTVWGGANKLFIFSYGYEATPETMLTAGDKGLPFYYLDADGDYHGASNDPGTVMSTDPGPGFSKTNDDCDDSNAQIVPRSPLIEWGKSCGGSYDDNGSSIQQTTDGGFIVAGDSYSNDGDVSGNHGNYDYWIVKLNSVEDLVWQKCFGGAAYDNARCIQQTEDGGFIVSGTTYSEDGDVSGLNGSSDAWIIKLDSVGNLEWQKCLGGIGQDTGNSIAQTIDGGYIAAGQSNGDCWIVKLDSSGNMEWQKYFGGTGTDYAYSVKQATDGGFVVAGVIYSNYNDDYWIAKLDIVGNLEWQKSLGGSNNDNAYSIQQTPDEGFIIAGSSGSNDGNVSGNHGGSDIWVVKLDQFGNMQWQKCLGGTNSEGASSIQITIDGGFVVAGNSASIDGDVSGNNGSNDYWIVKLGVNGNIEGENFFGGTFSEYANSIQQTSDSGLIVAGTSYSPDGDVNGNAGGKDFWIVKLLLPQGGIEICNNVDDNCNGFIDDGLVFSFFLDSDGDDYGNADSTIYTCLPPIGYVPNNTDCDDSSSAIYPGAVEIQNNGIDDNCDGYIDEFPTNNSVNVQNQASIQIFPNPTSGIFTVELKLNGNENAEAKIEVLNFLGQVIYAEKGTIKGGLLKKEITLHGLASDGSYLLKVEFNGHIFISKINLAK